VPPDLKRGPVHATRNEPRHGYSPSATAGSACEGVGWGGEVGDGEPVGDGLTEGDGGGGEVGIGAGDVTHGQVGLGVARGPADRSGSAGRRGGGALVRLGDGMGLVRLADGVGLGAVVGAGVGVDTAPLATAGSESSGGAARSSSRVPSPPTTAK
jgi:hypothetical protein